MCLDHGRGRGRGRDRDLGADAVSKPGKHMDDIEEAKVSLTSGLRDRDLLLWLLPSSRRFRSCPSSPLRLRFDEENELPTGDGERVSPCRAICRGYKMGELYCLTRNQGPGELLVRSGDRDRSW